MQISPKTAGKPGILKKQYIVILFIVCSGLTGLYFYQAFWFWKSVSPEFQ